MMIRFEKVTKSFHNHSVLAGLSFEVETGNFVSLIGGSGCGKTTLLKTINRLIPLTSGKILINGEDIEAKDAIALRRNIGYVIQQTGLFPHMTIQENIEIIPRLENMDANLILQKTKKLMRMVGLDEEFLQRYPCELSGGQQQRVGVARAFALDPEIILMDEPFSALDPITRSDLQDQLIHLQSGLKKTIVFVTHDMDEAIKLSDKICILDGGGIVQYDTPENILKNPVNSFVSDFVGKNRIWASPEYIKVADIMINNPITCPPHLSLFRCMEKMRLSKVDSLLVIDADSRKLLGIVKAMQIQNIQDRSQPVEKVMQTKRIALNPEDNILTAMEMINEHRVSSVPVLDPQGGVIGLVTHGSLFTTLSQQYLETGEALYGVC